MKLGSEGTGRKLPHLAPSSDLPNEVQGVHKKEITRKQIVSRSEHKPFRSLAERGIEAVPVKPGLLTRALSSLSSSFLSFFSSAIASVASNSQKEVRDLINRQLENQTIIHRDIKKLEEGLKPIEGRLQTLRESVELLTPEQIGEYGDLIAKQLTKHEQLVIKRAHLRKTVEQVQSYEQSLSASKSQQSLNMKVLEENISTGIEALMLLKDVFNKSQKKKHQGKVFEMRLGDIKVTDPDRYDFQVKNLVVNVGRFCFEKGYLELEVPELSAHCFSEGESKAVGPIKMKGSCRVRIGEPLAEPLNKLLTCRKTEIFSAYKKVSEALNSLSAETSGLAAQRRLGDIIQCSVDGLEMAGGEVKSDLFTEAMGEGIIRLFSPLVTTWKKELGAHSLKESRVKEAGDTVKAESFAALCQVREKSIKMLEEDLPKIKESKTKKACQAILAEYLTDLKRSRNVLQKKKEALSAQKNHTAAVVYREANAGKSVQSYQNALKLFHTLRGITRRQTSGQSASESIHFSEQRIDFTDTSHAELSSASLKLSGFSLGDDGVLEIKVPDVSLNLGLVNEVSDTCEAFPASFKDVSLKVSSPMGRIVHEILLLDFPLEFRALERLWKQYQACTSEHYSSLGAHEPVNVASYFSVDIGSMARLADGDVRIEAVERPDEDKELMVLAVSRLMGQKLEVGELGQLFQEEMGMNPQSSSQLMNLLCLGLLGEPEPLMNPAALVDAPLKNTVEQVSVSRSPEAPSPFNEQKDLSSPAKPTSLPKDVEVTPVINQEGDIRVNSLPQRSKQTSSPPSETPGVNSDALSESKGESKKQVFRALQEGGEKTVLSKTEIRMGDLSRCPGVSQLKARVNGHTPQVSFALKAPVLKVLGKLPLLLSWLVGSDLSLSVQAPLKEDVVQLSQPSLQVHSARVPFLGTWLANFWLKRALAKGQLAINSHQSEGQADLQFVGVEQA
ncbi:hypothetical protein [Endozoicomonas sp. SESOKO4]|uniref:hypothetical protein n=1 Tax=Endozoicomonas sp. SESOKO4 TaxID=2828745 RepID=UPI00214856F4|nr:hypothetical protein [Endozoicomonas sp. SESOKO4]